MLFTVLDQMKITTITKIKNLMSDCFNSLFSLQKIKVDKKFPIFIMDNIDSMLHDSFTYSLHILMNSVWLTIIKHIVFMICMMLKHLSISKRNHGLTSFKDLGL